MKLMLKDYKVLNLNFEILSEQNIEDQFNLKVGQMFSEEEKEKSFGIGFIVEIMSNSYKIKLEMRFFFESDEIIDDNFKKSSFPKVNAPAIAFPYLRAYISNLTMQSGFTPLLLPSINFIEFAGSNQ